LIRIPSLHEQCQQNSYYHDTLIIKTAKPLTTNTFIGNLSWLKIDHDARALAVIVAVIGYQSVGYSHALAQHLPSTAEFSCAKMGNTRE